MLNNTWGDLSLAFWGQTDSTIHAGRLRGVFYESCLFTKEASHYAYSLFIVSLIRFADNIVNNKQKIIDHWIVTCFALMFLSTSFASVNMLLSFVVIYLSYRWGVLRPNNMKLEISIVGTIVTMIVVLGAGVTIMGGMEGNTIGDRLSNFYTNIGDFMTFEMAY
ncbi:MAG: hypothetical protein J6X18_14825, partial [Bacteroidales bacterium]|nr:hypothetical protein [Bacteroidales bacterium]